MVECDQLWREDDDDNRVRDAEINKRDLQLHEIFRAATTGIGKVRH